MTELLSGPAAPSDAELIARVRRGDLSAYGELFERHVEAARRLARQLMRGPDVDDLVSDAFARTLTVLQGGGGPDVAFRAYLLTSVRRIHVDRIRSARRVQPADDMTAFDPGVAFHDPAVADFENGAAARAFRALPERWQLVLWHLEVEGQKPADVAPLLGMSANSVSALAYRAREGLRQAFLTMHATDDTPPECRWVTEHLGGYVRNGLSRRDSAKVDAHLKDCRRCTAVYLELTEVNSNLAAVIGPLLLGAVASAYASAGGSSALGVSALLGRVRDLFGAHAGGAAAGGSGVAAGGGVLGGSGLIAGGALTSSGVLAIGGIAAAAVAVTTTAALMLGGGTPAQTTAQTTAETTAETTSPAVAGSDPSTPPSPGADTGPSSAATDTSAAAGPPGPSTSARPLDGTPGADAGAPLQAGTTSTERIGGSRAAGERTKASGSPGTGPGTDSGTDSGTDTGGAHERDRSDRGAPTPEATPSRPAVVQQPDGAPSPSPYDSDAPVVEEPAPAAPTGQDGGQSDEATGGASPDATTGGTGDGESGSKGRGSRGNAGPGSGNDNGHHWGHDRGRGHDEDHDQGKGQGKGHGH